MNETLRDILRAVRDKCGVEASLAVNAALFIAATAMLRWPQSVDTSQWGTVAVDEIKRLTKPQMTTSEVSQ